MIYGIDLGTTNSLIARLDDGVPVCIPNALGNVLTPSVISLAEDDTLLVGQAARERLVKYPARTVASFKRLMGTEHETRLGQRKFKPEELSALVLRSLKDDVLAATGQTVSDVIISVPAYFNDQQRKATRLAGQLAGLNVRQLLNEPTAAALFHGIHDRDAESKFLVFDLGGGTFDVSILDRFSGIMEVRATGGDSFLGGDDFTQAMLKLMADRAGLSPAQRKAANVAPGLLHGAESAKRALTTAASASIALPTALGLPPVTITLEDYEKACAPLLERLRAPMERALRDARMRAADLSEIVLVGGATRMPMVRRLVAQLFGRLPARHPDPDQTIALGAAVCAGLVSRDVAFAEMVMTDVCPHSLGTSIAQRDGRGVYVHDVFLPIIERNTVVPASRVRSLTTLTDDQTSMVIDVYQGESRLCSQNICLGQIDVPIPKRKAGEVAVNVRYTYDINGILDVDVDVDGTDIARNLVIRQLAGDVPDEDIARRRKELAALKLHPREQEENRVLLERAERLYTQLLGDERSHVSALLVQFTGVLESQDMRLVAQVRPDFARALDMLEQGQTW
ncbi:MAG: Hsp70 family protein [Pseudomonadota bacterium]